MSHYVKISNTELVRDMKNKAILNTDRQEIDTFERNRKRILSEKRASQEAKERLEQLEKDMNDIKLMLSELKNLKDRHS